MTKREKGKGKREKCYRFCILSFEFYRIRFLWLIENIYILASPKEVITDIRFLILT